MKVRPALTLLLNAAAIPISVLGFAIIPISVRGSDLKEGTGNNDTLYDFDGEYGRKYLSFIRKMIPAYDDVLEMIGDIVSAQKARRILVIGPGHGDELLNMAKALPEAQIIAYESSDAMTRSSRKRMEQAGFSDRVTIIAEEFGMDTTCLAEEESTSFDVVTMLNVLHLLPREKQLPLLRAAAKKVSPNGILMVSGVSTMTDDYDDRNLFRRIADKRWERLGMEHEERGKIHTSLGKGLFGISEDDLKTETGVLGFSNPAPVYRGLLNVMWCIERNLSNKK